MIPMRAYFFPILLSKVLNGLGLELSLGREHCPRDLPWPGVSPIPYNTTLPDLPASARLCSGCCVAGDRLLLDGLYVRMRALCSPLRQDP